jgi:Tfp pilus assembly major pilin PilA
MNKNEKIIGAKKNGLTLIQLMTIIGVAGIVIAVAASKWG